MIQQTVLQKVIESQGKKNLRVGNGFEREVLPDLPVLQSHALIVSGIRRCGKSTLTKQILSRDTSKAFFLAFDDPRLYSFELADFEILDAVIENAQSETLYFDEIQVIEGWELYVRQKLDEGFRVVVTGSNASLLSRELGTKLTGRHITKELFPFSYREFLAFKKLENNEKSLQKYMENGGFPEFLKTNNTDILIELFADILNRDIIVRHGIRDARTLKNLAVYLVTNVGNPVTASKLQQPLGIKSAATVLDYFSFLEDTYLVHFLPKFSYSHKARLVNPRKIYIIDSGIIKIASASFTEDRGHLLENQIYWELRRKGKKLYYFNENGAECDFVVMKNEKIEQVIQVCYELLPENREREMRGLREAMHFFDTDNGLIITFNQRDAYMQAGKQIKVIPAWEFLNEEIRC
ncbi:MAG: ATP-binding protein [Dysgonamonadaceae bacterium]|jgi:predicted AAA+ superfamily ATPase|nr:ATP-binding protein [Dysgonamonadaceae bacterium]